MPRFFAKLFGPTRRARCAFLAEPLEHRVLLTRLAVIGDYSSNDQPQPLQDVSQMINSWSPDGVVTDSDNNYPNGEASTIDANVGQWFHQYIYPYKGSFGAGSADNQNHFWPSPGDHDWGTGSLQPYLNYFTLPNNGRYYTTQIGNIALFSIDAEPQEPDGMSANSVQAQWIKSQMLASTATWKIVVFADPAYSSGFFLGDPTMRWPFASWGATAVISGHAHDYERLSENGLTYFVDGLGGESADPFQMPQPGSQVRFNGDYGAMRIDSTSTSITFTFFTRTGQAVDTYTINSGVTNTPQVYTPLGTTWKYLDNGSNQGTAWSASSFNDSSWSAGPAELGFGDGSEATTTSGNITTYFRASFNVANPTAVQGLSLSLIEDQGSVIYINGTEVYRNDMPSGSISFTTPASSDINPGDDNHWLAGIVNTSPLVSGTNVIAVELHLPSASAGDLSFDLQLSATLGQLTVPAAPANVQATPASNHVTLNWTASGGATSYRIYRGTAPGGEGSTPYATNVPSNTFTDNSVTSGSTYYYQVTAVNAQGESARSNEVVAALVPPPAPTNLQATSGIGQIALSWASSLGASSYNIYRGNSPGGEGASPFASNVSTNSFVDTGLTPGSTFYYKVTAVNTIGESAKSNEASATVVVTPAHVVVVIESHFSSGIIGGSSAPYINSLANGGALFNNASAITYPGQPNYLGFFSGSTQGVTDDTVPSSQFSAGNLGSELIAAGLAFGGFAEGLPAVGSLVSTAGATDSAGNAPYQRYHNPWSDFSNIPSADNEPFSSFPTNFASLPTVSFVVPNMVDDMHDGTVSQADTWLQTNLGAYATWAATHNSMLLVTWDDNVSGTNPNQIDTIIYGQQVQSGVYSDAISHYNVLRTIEDLFALPRLGSAAGATTIQDAWHALPQAPPAPTSLQATSGGAQQISLTWTASTGASSYNVYRGTSPGGENATPIATSVPSPNFADVGLTPGVTYYYEVTAVSGAGESGRSNEANAATVKATPVFAGLTASSSMAYGAATVTLSGTLSSGTLIPPGSVMITINGSSTNAGINASTGAFSASFDTHAIPASATAYTITYSYAANTNYNAGSDTSTSLTVNRRTLHVTATGVNKIYDGTTAATVTLSDDHINGDAITAAYATAAFAAKNVGTGLSISVSGISLSGAAAGNYTLANTTTSATANITPRTLHVTATGQNKVYDGTTAASVSFADDRAAGDSFNVTASSITFASKTVGTAKTISVSGISISGADAANYTANTSTTATANITPLALTITATGQNKTYDGTTNATVTLSDNRVAGDSLTDAYTTAAFADKNVGAAKTVLVSGISISGADATNYTANTTASANANITARALAIAATGQNKIYDGTTTAAVTLNDNRVTGDNLATGYATASFADKNVGTSKIVSVSGITLSGTDAGNYTFNTTATASANITPRALDVTATGQSKTYDGTTAATVTLADNRIAGDALAVSFTSATFADKNIGTAKTITVSGISITGADTGNYTANNSTTASANITARVLTVTATGQSKAYDGTTAATVTLGDNRVSGDSLTTSYATASFTDKNVGTDKTITVSGITIGGADGGNYSANISTTASASITARALTVTATGQNKVYDGTSAAMVVLSDNQIAGDTLTTVFTAATFSDKNVGTGKTITVSGISIGGADAPNYSFNMTAAATANISPLALAITATGQNKTYDGTTAATVILGDNRIAGDSLTTNYTSATFGDKNVGTAKTVNVSGITLGGTDAGNYTFNTGASTTANITSRMLTITATGQNKVYDGTAAATVTLGDNRVPGDNLTPGYATATFADKNVGTGKAIALSGITLSGTDAGNYSLNSTTSASANITPFALVITAVGQNKTYDGTTAASVTMSDNRIAGDSLTTSYAAASFADKNVGTGKTISVSGITLAGGDAANYTFNTSATATANITALTLSVSGVVANNKTYDGTTAATINASAASLVGVVGGDDVTLATGSVSAAFASSAVGTNIPVSVAGLGLSGTQAANYTLSPPAMTASILPMALTVNGVTAGNKSYDGTTAATLNFEGAGLSGVVNGDVVTLNSSGAVGTFISANVGPNLAVSVSGLSLSGPAVANYTLTPPVIFASITPELLIPGTASADTITLLQDADHLHIDWFLNGSSIGQLSTNDPAGLTINGNGGSDTINLVYGNGNPLPATLHLDGNFTINGLSGSVPLAGTTLEIGRSTVYVSYNGANPIAAIQTALQAGYNNGGWNGSSASGAITSAAQANPSYMIGYADSADGVVSGQPGNTIELKYTLGGDLNLAGTVTFADFAQVVANFGKAEPWDGGAFTYDTTVGFADFALVVSNYGKQAVTSMTVSASAVSAAAGATGATKPSTNSGSSGHPVAAVQAKTTSLPAGHSKRAVTRRRK